MTNDRRLHRFARAALLLVPLALVACKADPQPGMTQPAAAGPAAPSATEGAEVPATTTFDIARLPVSEATLGEFPYLGLPQGYAARGTPVTAKLEKVPFWTGDRIEWAQGRVYSTAIEAGAGAFSSVELAANIESLVAQAGGQRIFSGTLPAEPAKVIADSPAAVKFVDGIGDIWNAPAQTYVIRRADSVIWIGLCANDSSAGLIVVETAAPMVTAALLPASELQQQLQARGKVDIQVNFATGKAEILPGSQPQIAQVLVLLQNDPALKLQVNGHTDNTGDEAQNQLLSKARAQSVVAALTASGIDPARLQADGFGQSRPVDDNATEQGRARNRRVELVRN